MSNGDVAKCSVYLDLTHVGRHVTGIERIAIEQFEKAAFDGTHVIPVRSKSVASMIFKQQVWLPLKAILHPTAQFAFPGFPPSPFFALIPKRVVMYVHDTFLMTRKSDLSTKARYYMAPSFSIAVRRLKRFLVNSEKTRQDLRAFSRPDAQIDLYRPSVANHFGLDPKARLDRGDLCKSLKLVSLGTIEPRKNYAAAVSILDHIRSTYDPTAELNIIGRAGWGEDAKKISNHPGVTVHGYLSANGVKQVIDNADVYLCTSHDEGLGLPLLEAQFAGLPVVAPDQPVFREVLGASGTFIDPSSPANAAEAIVAIIKNQEWRAVEALRATTNVAQWNARAGGDFMEVKSVFAPGK